MPEKQPSAEEIAQEVKRRQLEYNASFHIDPEHNKQADVASWTKGKRVHDIIETETVHGEGLLIWVFVPLIVGTPRKPDLSDGDEVALMFLYLEQNRQFVRFRKAIWQNDKYTGEKGADVLQEARQGLYL